MLLNYGIITALYFSKYASPISAQRKSKVKYVFLWTSGESTLHLQRLTLKKSNSQHFVRCRPTLDSILNFCTLVYDRAYHCLQIAYQRSAKLLAINFVSRTFACRRLAQSLSRSGSVFSSCMRDYLDTVVKQDQCGQYADDNWTKLGPGKSQSKWFNRDRPKRGRKFTLDVRLPDSGAASDSPQTTKLPSIPEFVWQQPQENLSKNINENSPVQTQKKNDTSDFRQRNVIESQNSPKRQTSPKVSGSTAEPFLENQTGSTPVQCLGDSKKRQLENQWIETDITVIHSGDDNFSPPKKTTSKIKKRLVKDEITNELYMPLISTIGLKWKKKMLHVPLDFENGFQKDALVGSRAYVSAIAQIELDRIKQQAPTKSSKSKFLPIFKFK